MARSVRRRNIRNLRSKRSKRSKRPKRSKRQTGGSVRRRNIRKSRSKISKRSRLSRKNVKGGSTDLKKNIEKHLSTALTKSLVRHDNWEIPIKCAINKLIVLRNAADVGEWANIISGILTDPNLDFGDVSYLEEIDEYRDSILKEKKNEINTILEQNLEEQNDIYKQLEAIKIKFNKQITDKWTFITKSDYAPPAVIEADMDMTAPCTLSDGCAGCTEDVSGNAVANGDCKWKGNVCSLNDGISHCQVADKDPVADKDITDMVKKILIIVSDDDHPNMPLLKNKKCPNETNSSNHIAETMSKYSAVSNIWNAFETIPTISGFKTNFNKLIEIIKNVKTSTNFLNRDGDGLSRARDSNDLLYSDQITPFIKNRLYNILVLIEGNENDFFTLLENSKIVITEETPQNDGNETKKQINIMLNDIINKPVSNENEVFHNILKLVYMLESITIEHIKKKVEKIKNAEIEYSGCLSDTRPLTETLSRFCGSEPYDYIDKGLIRFLIEEEGYNNEGVESSQQKSPLVILSHIFGPDGWFGDKESHVGKYISRIFNDVLYLNNKEIINAFDKKYVIYAGDENDPIGKLSVDEKVQVNTPGWIGIAPKVDEDEDRVYYMGIGATAIKIPAKLSYSIKELLDYAKEDDNVEDYREYVTELLEMYENSEFEL